MIGNHEMAPSRAPDGNEEVYNILLEQAKGTPAEKVAAEFVDGLRAGRYTTLPVPEAPEVAAVTAAVGQLMKTAAQLGHGIKPCEAMMHVFFDPADGPGAHQLLGVSQVEMCQIPVEYMGHYMVGFAAQLWQRIHRPLRAIILETPNCGGNDAGNISGEIGVLLSYLDSKNEVVTRYFYVTVESKDGEWTPHPMQERGITSEYQPSVEVMKGMYGVSQAVRAIHPKIRSKLA
jgi:hypothetical protein